MLVQEGFVFLILVILGGGALIYYFLKESKMLQERESFFAAFTHDLKTTIATHRLSLESLIQVNRSISQGEYKKMFAESQALGLKLENALMLSQNERHFGVFTKIKFSEVVSSIKRMWPELEVSINKDVQIKVDKVFLTSVLMNLFQNAIQHAQATSIHIEVSDSNSKNKARIEISNNGKPFEGEVQMLGKTHYYRGQYRGSGLGLYISRNLMKKMNGELSFHNKSGPLAAIIEVEKSEMN
jgi:signal transduction histidine kinase